MPWPFLIPIVAILAWAVVQIAHVRAKSAPADETAKRLDDLTTRLGAALSENEALRSRVENLEAIVTSETYDLLREDPTRGRLALPDEVAPDEAVARAAQRVRG